MGAWPKKVVLIVLFMLILSAPAYADNPITKLTRGIINIVTCPLEFIKGFYYGFDNTNLAVSIPFGIFEGLKNTGIRAAVGVYEVVTFPIPFPAGYKPILKDDTLFENQKLVVIKDNP